MNSHVCMRYMLTLYDPGRGVAIKEPPPQKKTKKQRTFALSGLNFRSTLLCVGDFSPKIILHHTAKKIIDWQWGSRFSQN